MQKCESCGQNVKSSEEMLIITQKCESQCSYAKGRRINVKGNKEI